MATADSVVDNTKFEELCRLCAAKTTLILAIHIFENDGSIRQISKKIESCLPLHVHEQDELPKMICEDCLYKLEMFFDFRERCVKTQRLLLDLYKEIKNVANAQIHIDQQCVNMDQNELIMVQQHQLLNHNLQNMSEIDLAQLSQREGMIVGHHEIILTHHTVDINSHSLDSIELNNRDLMNQDLSNQSLQTQESIMVDSASSHNIQDSRFSDENLIMQHHHLLTDQFRLQHDLQVTMTNEANVTYSIPSDHSNQGYHHEKSNESHMSTIDYSEIKVDDNSLTVDSNLTNSSLSVDQHLNGLKLHIYTTENNQIDHIHQDSSNNDDYHLTNVGNVLDKQGYLLSSENAQLEEISHSFYCDICGKMYKNQDDLESHYGGHFYKCNVCIEVFNTVRDLELHKSEGHVEKDEDVSLKGDEFEENDVKDEEINDSNDNVENSTSNLGGEIVNSAETESNSIENVAGVNQQEEEHNSGGNRKKWSPKTCKECGKIYKTNYKLQEHMRKHTGEKPYKCRSCEKTFRSKIGLAQHEAKHTGEYTFSCPTCGKGFQCKSYLMVHQRVHSDEKPFPCTTCGQNFKTKQSLLDHTNRHLGVKPYMCEICGRGFITKGLCKAHQKIHSGLDNRQFACKICNKMFVSKSYLRTHLRIHTGEKSFICEVCGKGFLTRVDLKIHSTMHTGEKSYVCEMCGKAFARRDALRCHRRSHTGERPYSCDICGHTFTQFTPMAIHKRLHTGERPYACEVCDKKFVSRSTMMAHAKKHIKEENKLKMETKPDVKLVELTNVEFTESEIQYPPNEENKT